MMDVNPEVQTYSAVTHLLQEVCGQHQDIGILLE